MPLPRVVAAPMLQALQLLILLPALLVLPLAGTAAQSTTSDSASNAGATTVAGTVYDSLAGKPLAGALVQLVANGEEARVWSATTDTSGEFELTGVPSGKYIVGFLHPSLDSLGLGVVPRTIDVSGATPTRIVLAAPSAMTIRNQLCAQPEPTDSTGLVLGFIREADSGLPLGGATMVVMWTELVVDNGIHTDRRQVPVKANSEGWYALCGVPSDAPITARAELGKDASGYIEIAVPPHGLLHRDFGIPTGAATIVVTDTVEGAPGMPVRRGSARLAGVVRNAQGKPLGGAQLMVWGSGIAGSTRDDGTFSLSDLPAGTQALEARYVGYAPKRLTVELASGQMRSVTVTLDERADVLSEVTVYGKRGERRSDITGFLERRDRGFGHFLTRADIEQQHPFQFSDLMRMVPGFRVAAGEGFSHSIVSTRGGNGISGVCKPDIYLNGMRLWGDEDVDMLIEPGEIAGVEAYAGAAGSPPQYTNGPCGSIVIWTGPDLGDAKN